MEENPNLKVLQALSRINSAYSVSMAENVSLGLIHTFLTVARNPGKTGAEIAALAKTPRPTVTRHLLDLSVELRNKQRGYDVIERVLNPKDARSVVFKLTTKGKKLMAQLTEALGEDPSTLPPQSREETNVVPLVKPQED